MKNVLFIVYYFPPMGGSGVQRPLKFVKYLREFGWNPIVLCPEPGAYHTFDDSLKQELDQSGVEVHRVKGETPLHVAGNKKIGLPGPVENLLRKVSTFFWMPDNKKGWVKPGLNKALELIEEREIDIVFSTAAPYSDLILAAELKKITGVKVVMDLRDEWLESHLIKYPTGWHKKKMASIEKETLEHADVITVINGAYKESFKKRFPRKEIKVIEQGFDPGDFQDITEVTQNKKLRFLYSGLFYGERTPHLFFKAVSEILNENPKVREEIEWWFQGGLSEPVRSLINELGLNDVVYDYGYLQHSDAVKNLNKADILWLMVGHLNQADKVTVGKMFEYFGSRKPILALAPEGETLRLLKEYGAFYYAQPRSLQEIKKVLKKIIKDYRDGKMPEPDNDFISRYNRKSITRELASIFNVISS